MEFENLSKFFDAKMSGADFTRLSSFIYNEYGIKMPPQKKIMLQSRLQKRLRELNIPNFKDYCNYVFSKEGEGEIIHMIDVVSTNKTDFFREPAHFDFLTESALPGFVQQFQGRRPVKIWSAGCSSGEEPYTLAIVISEFIEKNQLLDYQIFATDISTRVLEKAALAIYPEDRVDVFPLFLKKKYLLKSKDKTKKTVRLIPSIRHKVTFQRLNFIDSSYNINEVFDIIFCRNVLIYFDRETQEKVINKLCKNLHQDGIFFLGHSESITSISVPLKQIKPTIFRRL